MNERANERTDDRFGVSKTLLFPNSNFNCFIKITYITI